MKILFDFLPIILFFVAYLLKGIWVATLVAIVASVALFAWIYLKKQKPNLMQWLSVIIIIIFGGATLILGDSSYIKLKPTVLYLLMGAALLIARYVFKSNLLLKLIGEKITLPAFVWDRLNWIWAMFFTCMAMLNYIVAINFSENTWAYFKMFGTLILTFLFVIAQSFYLAPYMEESLKEEGAEEAEKK